MKIRLKGIQEGLEWGFELVANRLGIDRRHILFGVIVLLISALLTALYIYQKNWVIAGKRAVGRSEQLTISLNGTPFMQDLTSPTMGFTSALIFA